MRALLTDADPPGVRIAETAEPVVRSDQALVAVRAFSLNRGEVKRLESVDPGRVVGWDVAGVVERPAEDGTGPEAGARVVGVVDPYGTGAGTGAWAERAAVPTEALSELPDAVDFADAATLPVAGLTALRALELGGFVLGRRVLVTGASGGVGRFAVQLAALAGAHVTALARRGAGLRELGADEVIDELEAPADVDFDVVLDGLGGETLGTALRRVAPRGIIVTYASTLPDPVSFPARDFFARAPEARLRGLYLFDELAHTRDAAAQLRRLADLLADGRLRAEVDLTLDWSEAERAIGALLDRRVAGKAVLTVG